MQYPEDVYRKERHEVRPRVPAAVIGLTLAGLIALGAAALTGCGDTDQQAEAPVATATSETAPTSGATAAIDSPSPAARPGSDPGATAAYTEGEARELDLGPIPEHVTYEDAEAAYHSGDYRQSVWLFTGYTREHPENPWGHYMLGLAAWKAGLNNRAEAAFERALELDPGHVKSLHNLSRVLLEEERPADALRRLRTALELDPKNGESYRLLGVAFSDLGKTGEAIESYRRAIALDGQDAWAMNNLGLILIREGRFEDALGPLARATELRPEVATFQNNLGVALERTGHESASADAYRAALEADSGYSKAEVSLARVEARVDTEPSLDLEAIAHDFAVEAESWTAASASPASADDTVLSARPIAVPRLEVSRTPDGD